MPFPTMPAALANGQVDAIHTPEPFMSQILARGGRIVLAPGPVITPFLPNGCYCAREDWMAKNPALVKRFRTAINQSLVYSNSHPDEVRALLPAAIRNIRLPNWSPLIDRVKAPAARRAGEEVRHHQDAPEHDDVRAELRRGRHVRCTRRSVKAGSSRSGWTGRS